MYYQAFTWTDWWKKQKYLFKLVGVPVEIRTDHLLHTSQERYCNSRQLIRNDSLTVKWQVQSSVYFLIVQVWHNAVINMYGPTRCEQVWCDRWMEAVKREGCSVTIGKSPISADRNMNLRKIAMNEEFLDRIIRLSNFVMIMKCEERIRLHKSTLWIIDDEVLRNTNRVVSSHVTYDAAWIAQSV
jgi:hypothetical protein